MAEHYTLKFNPNRKFEDELLLKYFEEVGGLFFLEVRVGQGGVKIYPAGARPRRIDAVRIPTDSNALIAFNHKTLNSFLELIRRSKVDLRMSPILTVPSALPASGMRRYDCRQPGAG